MKIIDATDLDFRTLNHLFRYETDDEFLVKNCLGQRFIAAGMSDKKITLNGITGNALGAYLNNAQIIVNANAQDAVGDTMNAGKIIIHGSIGDAAGYAMRGGCIYVQGNAGYRAGIHMKAYEDKIPVMIIGGCAGSFLGEYQAGGLIIVLGLNADPKRIVGNFSCTGMHGGKMFLRGDHRNLPLPSQVSARIANQEDLNEIRPHLEDYCSYFDRSLDQLFDEPYTVITPDSQNPYHQMYVLN